MKIDYTFKDSTLVTRAFTHSSFSDDNYERLEFLGDAVLDLCIDTLLFKKYPNADEGELTKMRSSLVNAKFLAELAIKLELYRSIKVGKGEEVEKIYLKEDVLCDVFEAVVGAIYTDSSFDKTLEVMEVLFSTYIENIPVDNDFKSELQKIAQKKLKNSPKYTTKKIGGSDNDPVFESKVTVGCRFLGVGEGYSKKVAEQNAAQQALMVIYNPEASYG